MKIVAHNRRARFDYEIFETVEAGILLTGQEVKSCRVGHVHLQGSYVTFPSGVPTLKRMKIMPYAFASGLEHYDPERDRPLLLKKPEAEKLRTKTETKGVTVVPLEVRAGEFVKVLLGLGRGRKKGDKRFHIREREVSRRLRERGEE